MYSDIYFPVVLMQKMSRWETVVYCILRYINIFVSNAYIYISINREPSVQKTTFICIMCMSYHEARKNDEGEAKDL